MDKRLDAISHYIDAGKGFVDVGTDHGYLPVWMARRGYEGNIYASDLRSGPLSTAKANAERYGLEDRIDFLLCDGLVGTDPEKIDTIVIAGMGGDTICHILDQADWVLARAYKLILQPMSKSEVLRYWLTNNQFEISQEELIEDSGTLYQLIVARFGGVQRLSDAQLFLGDIKQHRDPELYRQQKERLYQRFSRALKGMENSENRNAGIVKLYRGILNELGEAQK